jgi:hypothetical protein
MITASEYFGFAIGMSLAFGVVFELPIAILGLTALGLVTPQFLNKYRRHAVVLCIVAAAFITPGADPTSLFALSVPLYLLFEFSVVLSAVVYRSAWRARRAATPSAARAGRRDAGVRAHRLRVGDEDVVAVARHDDDDDGAPRARCFDPRAPRPGGRCPSIRWGCRDRAAARARPRRALLGVAACAALAGARAARAQAPHAPATQPPRPCPGAPTGAGTRPTPRGRRRTRLRRRRAGRARDSAGRDSTLVRFAEPDSTTAALLRRPRLHGHALPGRHASASSRGSACSSWRSPAAVQRDQTLLVGTTVTYDDSAQIVTARADSAQGDTVVLRDPAQGSDVVVRGGIRYDLTSGAASSPASARRPSRAARRWLVQGRARAHRQRHGGERPARVLRARRRRDDVQRDGAALTLRGPRHQDGLEEHPRHPAGGALHRDVPVMWLPFIFTDPRGGRAAGCSRRASAWPSCCATAPRTGAPIENSGTTGT